VANLHPGVKGTSSSGFGVAGIGWTGVQGIARAGGAGDGVLGQGDGTGAGVNAYGTDGPGVRGTSQTGYGVFGTTNSVNSSGVYGSSNSGNGVEGWSLGPFKGGVVGIGNHALAYGGYFKNAFGGTALFVDGLSTVRTLAIVGGADLAERFDAEGAPEPGTVMMIDERSDGHLRVASEPYSHRVAGVVSGANRLSAGVVLSEDEASEGTAAIALSGRVWVKCDAAHASIRPGDLLTTADRDGYAMRADDRERAYGAILGKAMTTLETGTGLVLVLVSLQ
jgi:hypothetical protein